MGRDRPFPDLCVLEWSEDGVVPVRLPRDVFLLFGECNFCDAICCGFLLMVCERIVRLKLTEKTVGSATAPCRRGLALAADALARPFARKPASAHQALPGPGLPVALAIGF